MISLMAGVMPLGCVAPEDESKSSAQPSKTEPGGAYTRIVSMAPGLTEALFALGLGDRIVGVTRFCTYPAEAKNKAKIGGHMDPNYEAIVTLRPDLVLMSPYNAEAERYLTGLGLNCRVVRQESLADILASVTEIGRICGVAEEATAVTERMNARIQSIQKAIQDRPRPRVLMVIGRDYSAGTLEQVYIAGRTGFHGKIIEMAGGVNPYDSETIAYPLVSAEGILRMNPDVIIEMIPNLEAIATPEAKIRAAWDTLPGLPAAKNGRVHLLRGDYVSIPGPRVVQVLEDVARALHPDVDFDTL